MLRRGRILAVLVVAMGTTTASAAPVSATEVTGDVTAVSDAGPPYTVPGGRYSSDRGTVTLSGTRAFANVGAVDRTGGRFHVHLTAPEGRDLAVGVYDHAVGFPGYGSGAPGISVGDGCGEKSGRFEIMDIAFDADGEPTRLWAVYEARCPYPPSTLFGEIRIGQPARPVLATTPTLIRWPAVDPLGLGAVVPVAVRVRQRLQIASVTVSGPDAAAMPVRLDECTGRTVEPELGCEVFVRFTPTTGGTRTAVLRVRSTDGRTADVRLQGYAHGGRTRLVVRGEPGEHVTDGRAFSFTPGDASFAIAGGRRGVSFRVGGAGGWSGAFTPGAGDILAPGRFVDPGDRYPEVTPGVDIAAPDRSCHGAPGAFTVTEATFAAGGEVRTFGADFEQRCEPGKPALRGTFEYRVGDPVPPAPWTLAVGVFGPPTPLVPPSGPEGAPWPEAPASTSAQPAADPAEPTAPATPSAPVGAGAPAITTPSAVAPKAVAPSVPAGVPAAGPGVALPAPTVPSALTPARGGERCTAGAWRLLSRRGDRFAGTAAAERIRGGGGADVLRLGGGDDCADGGAGADRLDGNAGADVLAGGAGADVLAGGAGRDALDGGPGRDRLDCGPGRDAARVGPGDTARNCERITRTRVR